MSEIQTEQPVRYNGFTCPNCGSHMFRTFVINPGRVYKDFPKESTVGACTENHYTLNECDFKWNRDVPEEESKVMYQQTYEEHMATYVPFEQLENSTP